MPRSDRSLLAPAIFGLIVISAFTGATLYSAWAGPVPEQYEKPHASPERYAAATAENNYAAYPVEYSNDCYAAKSHDSADLCAQWRAAFAAEKAAQAAWWAVAWGIASFILSVVGLGALLLTIRQGREGLNRASEANEISARSQRPWLAVSLDLVGSAKFTDPGLHFDGYFVIKNVGNRPALDVSIQLDVFNSIKGEPEEAAKFGMSCRGAAIDKEVRGFVIAPNEETSHYRGFKLLSEKFEVGANAYRTILPLVVVSVIYRHDGDKEIKQTVKSFVIESVSLMFDNHYGQGFRIGQAVPASALRIRHANIGSAT